MSRPKKPAKTQDVEQSGEPVTEVKVAQALVAPDDGQTAEKKTRRPYKKRDKPEEAVFELPKDFLEDAARSILGETEAFAAKRFQKRISYHKGFSDLWVKYSEEWAASIGIKAPLKWYGVLGGYVALTALAIYEAPVDPILMMRQIKQNAEQGAIAKFVKDITDGKLLLDGDGNVYRADLKLPDGRLACVGRVDEATGKLIPNPPQVVQAPAKPEPVAEQVSEQAPAQA